MDTLNKAGWFENVTVQRKIEFVAIIVATLILFISAAFLISINKPSQIDKKQIEKLVKQREILEQNSETLIRAVADLNSIIKRNNIKDSVVSVLLSQQSNLIPNINSRLNEIDKSYKNIATISRYTSDDVKKYIAEEANRIRNSGNANIDRRP